MLFQQKICYNRQKHTVGEQMNYCKKNEIEFPDLSQLHFMIEYSETDRKNHIHEIHLHTHEKLEIYINLTGDVSFLVENNLYPLNRGDIIVARPHEYHHCVYNSDSHHKFFWILLDCNGNKALFDFLTANTKVNFISPDEQSREEIINCCYKLTNKELPKFDECYLFFRFMSMIKMNVEKNIPKINRLPDDFMQILDYIDNHISEDLKVMSIADTLYLSQSTIERRFSEYLHIKPLEFIRKQKLILAAEFLRNGETVLNAGTYVGYSDNSYFIKLFKQYYGVTPLQFKKCFQKEN